MTCYKEIDLEQRSKEWLLWRRTHLTATDSAKIIGRSPYVTPFGCYMEKVGGKQTKINAIMQRGIALESKAVEFLENMHGITFEPGVFESTKYPFMGASLDAISKNRLVMAEIKCPMLATVRKAMAGNINITYLIQCQKQMLVMGLTSMILFFYYDEAINFLQIIERDDKMIDEIIKAETNFWNNHMLKLEPPPLCDKDYKANSGVEINGLVSKWSKVLSEEKEIKKTRLKIENEIKQQVTESTFFTFSNVKYQKGFRKGAIDFARYCDDNNISDKDLEEYRKENVEYSRFFVLGS